MYIVTVLKMKFSVNCFTITSQSSADSLRNTDNRSEDLRKNWNFNNTSCKYTRIQLLQQQKKIYFYTQKLGANTISKYLKKKLLRYSII